MRARYCSCPPGSMRLFLNWLTMFMASMAISSNGWSSASMHWLATLRMDSLVATVLDLIVPDRTTWSSPDGTNNRSHVLLYWSLGSWIHPPLIAENGMILGETICPESVSRPPYSTIKVSVGNEQAYVVTLTRINALRDGPWSVIPWDVRVEEREHPMTFSKTSLGWPRGVR